MKLTYTPKSININDCDDELFNEIVDSISNLDLEFDDGEAQVSFSYEFTDEDDDNDLVVNIEGELWVTEYKERYSASLYELKMYVHVGGDQFDASFYRKSIDNDNIEDFLADVETAVSNEFKRK